MSEPPAWQIREALPGEADSLSRLALRSKAYWGYPDRFMQACLEELTLDKPYIENNPVFVMEIAGRVIGFYALEYVSASETELGYLFVDPEFIGKDYGRKLMAHAKQQAGDFGYSKIIILGDPNAEPFYRSAGGTLVGYRKSASIPDRELPLFQIDLNSIDIQIRRGDEYGSDPCQAIAKMAARLYGRQSALPASLLRRWYRKNASIFRIAESSDGNMVGYISTLPLGARKFETTLQPDFQETSIQAEDIEASFFSADGGVFLSSIAVAPEYQQRSPVSLLLRLAFVEDLLDACSKKNIRISAQALSQKGQRCMESLGMKICGATIAGWKIYHGELNSTGLRGTQKKLQQKFSLRFKM